MDQSLLGGGRVFVLKDLKAVPPTDLAGLTTRELPNTDLGTAETKDALRKFAKMLKARRAGFAAPSSPAEAEVADGGLGVAKTYAAARRRLLKVVKGLQVNDDSEYIEFDSNRACVDAYIHHTQREDHGRPPVLQELPCEPCEPAADLAAPRPPRRRPFAEIEPLEVRRAAGSWAYPIPTCMVRPGAGRRLAGPGRRPEAAGKERKANCLFVHKIALKAMRGDP